MLQRPPTPLRWTGTMTAATATSRADVWPRGLAGNLPVQTRAAISPAQRIGLSIAGTLFVELDNRDGLYDPANPNSPLFGNLAGGQAHPVADGQLRWGAQNAVDGMGR